MQKKIERMLIKEYKKKMQELKLLAVEFANTPLEMKDECQEMYEKIKGLANRLKEIRRLVKC